MPYDPERHGPRITGGGFRARVAAVVRRVPRGAVTTYGDVAAALGLRSLARQVGWALAALPPDAEAAEPVPWWRVVDGQGVIPRAGTAAARRQRALLQRDGVDVGGNGRVLDFAERRHRY